MREDERFVIEGSVCFLNCPPDFQPRIELYDMWPSGTRRFIITLAPKDDDLAAQEVA